MTSSSTVLLSIHMTSNRPEGLKQFFDRLEASTEDPRRVEVVIKIDSDNAEMNEILPREQARRPFKITYISTPLEGGFFGLWSWYDRLLELTDPSAYFVVSLNDEMYFVDQGWDARLIKYVDVHSDGIYRLRLSMHRERNTFDFWEASCAGELTPFITKKWLDLSGGWCPCNGPDSFQNAVAFYFGWLYRHETFNRPYRERIVHDLEFGAQGANLGIADKQAMLRRTRGALAAWFTLVSYPMQQEAARRALLLHAHIWATTNRVLHHTIDDDKKKKILTVCDVDGRSVWSASYRISRIWIEWSNFRRKFSYAYYLGAGESYRSLTPETIQYYFLLKYDRSLNELPSLSYSPTGNSLADSLPCRYMRCTIRIGVALFLSLVAAPFRQR